jgi:hypothetical protein
VLLKQNDLIEIASIPHSNPWKRFKTKIAGTKYDTPGGKPRGENFYWVEPGDPVCLVWEPKNRHDANAVIVLRFSEPIDIENQLGYLRAHVAEDVVRWHKKGFHIYGEIEKKQIVEPIDDYDYDYYDENDFFDDDYYDEDNSYYDCLLNLTIYIPENAPFELILERRLGLGEKMAKTLIEAGVMSFDKSRSMTDDELLSIPGVGPGTLKKIRAAQN